MSWDSPDDGGNALTGYKLDILSSSGSYYALEGVCGSDDNPDITQCNIPMRILRNQPFNLITGDEIVVAVRARNVKGWSSVSLPSQSDTTIKSEPLQMEPPAV
jgi:hypothetical protein